MQNDAKDQIVLTTSMLEAWGNERKQLVADRDKIDTKIATLDAKLRAAAVLMDLPAMDMAELATPESEEREQGETMTTAIVRVLSNTTKSLTRSEIRGELHKDQALAARLERTPNSFYNAMKRLQARAEIMRVAGDRFTVPAKE